MSSSGVSWRGFPSPIQVPTTSPDDWRDSIVSVTQSTLGSNQWTQPRSCCIVPPGQPSSSSCYCSRFQCYHYSVGWADDPTCLDCHTADNMVAYLFMLSHTSNAPEPGGYVGGTALGPSVHGEPPTVCRYASCQDRFKLFPFFAINSVGVSFLFSSGPLSSSPLLFSPSSHLPHDPEVGPSSLLNNNNRPGTRRKFLILKSSHCQLRRVTL